METQTPNQLKDIQIKEDFVSPSELRSNVATVNANKWQKWEKEWNKVKHYIAETITESSNFGHSECKFSLKEIHFIEIAKDLDYLKHAFVTRGYEVSFELERSPNGVRSMTVKW